MYASSSCLPLILFAAVLKQVELAKYIRQHVFLEMEEIWEGLL